MTDFTRVGAEVHQFDRRTITLCLLLDMLQLPEHLQLQVGDEGMKLKLKAGVREDWIRMKYEKMR